MGKPYAPDRRHKLNQCIDRRVRPGHAAIERRIQSDTGIKMRARQRAENGDQHHQRRAGRQNIGQERHCHIPACQPFSHDAGADHGHEQQSGPLRFGNKIAAHDCWPMSVTCFCSDSRSNAEILRLAKAVMRLLSMR
jgi:hypothetical protein